MIYFGLQKHCYFRNIYHISYVHTLDTSPVEHPLLKVFPGVDKKQRCKRRKGIIYMINISEIATFLKMGV